MDDYLDALEHEMRGAREMFAPKRLQTVYIGGGTPTTLDSGQLDRLLCMIRYRFYRTGIRRVDNTDSLS